MVDRLPLRGARRQLTCVISGARSRAAGVGRGIEGPGNRPYVPTIVSRRLRCTRAVAAVVSFVLVAAPAMAQVDATPITLVRRGDDVVLEIGPVDVPQGGPVIAIPTASLTFPVNGWLNGYDFEVVDSSGAEVPSGVAVVNVYSVGERELFSPLALRLAAIAGGTPSATLPRFIGYRAFRGDTVVVTTRLHPSATRAYAGLRARIRFPYVSASAFIGALRIQPFAMEVLPPGDTHTFDLPQGPSAQSWEGKPAVSGRILGFGTHVDRWATALVLEDRTSGDTLWHASFTPAADGSVKALPAVRFVSKLGLSLRTGHVYRLTVQYDNRSGAPIRDGGVGTLAGVFMPGHGEHWPAVDRTDPIYLADMAAVRGK